MHNEGLGQLRDSILEPALRMAASQGEDSITAECVAKHAPCTVEDVHALYGNLDDLVADLPTYINRRKIQFLRDTVEATTQPEVGAQLIAVSEGYYSYVETNPELFRYLFEHKLSVTQQQWDALRQGKLSGNESLDMLYIGMEDLAAERGVTVGEGVSSQILAALSVLSWATIHGLGHLSVIGVLRHQHSVLRRYNLKVVYEALYNAILRIIDRGDVADASDRLASLRQAMAAYDEEVPPRVCMDGDHDLSAMSPEEARECMLECAIELAGEKGADAVCVEDVARHCGAPVSFVTEWVNNDFALRERIEELTDAEFTRRMEYLHEHSSYCATAADHLECVSVAFFSYALKNPRRFSALISAASHSVVPIREDGIDQTDMGESLAYLMRITRQRLHELGQHDDDKLVYIKNLTLWATANGMSHLASLGELRKLDEDDKWELFYLGTQVIMESFSYGIEY